MTEKEIADILPQIPKPPDGSSFSIQKLETVCIPHPFVIGPRHVAYASDRCGGILGTDAIRDSGVPCQWKDRHGNRCTLDVDAHETPLTLFIRVPQNRDLNAIDGLHAYLLSIKEQAEKLGVKGFAFPT